MLFSLQQQAVVAQVQGTSMYVDVKTGRPRDIRTYGGGFSALLEGFTKKSQRAVALKEKWEREHPKRVRAKV